MTFGTISIIGLGYVGLPTAVMLASHRKQVVGVDTNQQVVDTVNDGGCHIVEPELDALVSDVVAQGFLKAKSTVEKSDAFLITVPTPFLPLDSPDSTPNPNLSYIKSASQAIAQVLKAGDIVILESTSPVGTTEEMAFWLENERPDLTFPQTHGDESDIRIAYCPERVLPGKVMLELVRNDRIIGGMTEHCARIAVELYKIFVKGQCVITNSRTAEMAKLAENSFRDVNIAFANELSVICDKLAINVWDLIELTNRHPRVNVLQPGPGVGGHCISVDPWFLVSRFPEDAKLIREARLTNNKKPYWVLNKLKLEIEDYLISYPEMKSGDIVIACYGLAYKPNIDDLRESPAMFIAQKIVDMHSGQVLLVEPHIDSLPESFNDCKLSDLDFANLNADIHLLLVDHDLFKINRPQKGKIIDTRGIWKNTDQP